MSSSRRLISDEGVPASGDAELEHQPSQRSMRSSQRFVNNNDEAATTGEYHPVEERPPPPGSARASQANFGTYQSAGVGNSNPILSFVDFNFGAEIPLFDGETAPPPPPPDDDGSFSAPPPASSGDQFVPPQQTGAAGEAPPSAGQPPRQPTSPVPGAPDRVPTPISTSTEEEIMSFLCKDWDPSEVPPVIFGKENDFSSLPMFVLGEKQPFSIALNIGDPESAKLAKWQADAAKDQKLSTDGWYVAAKENMYFHTGAVKDFFNAAHAFLSELFVDPDARTIARLFVGLQALVTFRDHFGLFVISDRALHKYAVETYVKLALRGVVDARKLLTKKDVMGPVSDHALATDINSLPASCEIDLDSVLDDPDFAPNVLKKLQAERIFSTRLRLSFLTRMMRNRKAVAKTLQLFAECMPASLDEFKLQLFKIRKEQEQAVSEGWRIKDQVEALRRQLNAEGSKVNPDLVQKLILMSLMDPEELTITRHFVFSELEECIRLLEGMPVQQPHLLDTLRTEGVIPEDMISVVRTFTMGKYKQLAQFFRDGNYLRTFSCDAAFDGAVFLQLHPFLNSNGYIGVIDFSLPMGALSPEAIYDIMPLMKLIKKLIEDTFPCVNFGIDLQNMFPKNMWGFFDAVNEGKRSSEKLSSVVLNGTILTAKDLSSLCNLISKGSLRELDLGDCILPSFAAVQELLIPAIRRCRRLQLVNFSNLQCGSCLEDAVPLDSLLMRDLLIALSSSKPTLKELWCAGPSHERSRMVQRIKKGCNLCPCCEEELLPFGALKVTDAELSQPGLTTAQVLRDLVQYPELISVNFSYQQIPPFLVADLVVYISKTSKILFAFFDCVGNPLDVTIHGSEAAPWYPHCYVPCCCCWSKTIKTIATTAPSLKNELNMAVIRNQIRQGTTCCFRVVSEMLTRYAKIAKESYELRRISRETATYAAAIAADRSALMNSDSDKEEESEEKKEKRRHRKEKLDARHREFHKHAEQSEWKR